MTRPNPKYKLTDQTILFNGHTLHRIRALRDFLVRFAAVRIGELGGWVESEDNLSHEGVCWIENQAKVFEDARVGENALISNEAKVFDDARVGENAWISGEAKVFEDASVSHHAWVSGFAAVGGHASVGGKALIYGAAYGDLHIEGTAHISTCEGQSIHISTCEGQPIHITTGHFTSGHFNDQAEVEAYLADLKTKGQEGTQPRLFTTQQREGISS